MRRNAIIYIALLFLIFIKPFSVNAGLVETIDNTCPSDPTQNGRCALIETKVDEPSCKTIGGQQVCKDWWRKDFKFQCSGAFDPDAILAKVGNRYCEYKNECSEWIDVEKNGGNASCRIYVDINRPGCNSNSFGYNCIANDCGDLFQRCSLKQYIKYSDIPDRGNMNVDPNCNPASGSCSSQMLDSEKSGVKLGLYTFSCPSEVRRVCKTYSGKLRCPDGREQVCNRVKVCKRQQSVSSQLYELKSCAADRPMQTYQAEKVCNPYGCHSSSQGESYKSNNNCIKTGEISLCNLNNGCTDVGSYGVGGFVRNGGTFNWLGGWNACDWGYAVVRGAGNGNINVYAFATGCRGSCGSLNVTISKDTPRGTVIGYVHPHWEGSCVTLAVTYNGYDCSGGGCIYNIGFHGMGARPVNVPIVHIAETFNCYQDSYENCGFDGELQCRRLSSSNINDLECIGVLNDADAPHQKAICTKFIINYECPKEKQTTECAEYDEVLRCNNAVYPIRDVRVDSYDFSTDFIKAMALAQATNELKHVWSGEPYRCESGMWWLFDNMDFGAFVAGKAMSAAMAYFGQEYFPYLSPGLQTLADCAGAAITTITTLTNLTAANTYSTPSSSLDVGIIPSIASKIASKLDITLPKTYSPYSGWQTRTATENSYITNPEGERIPVNKGDTILVGPNGQSRNLSYEREKALGAAEYAGDVCRLAASAVTTLARGFGGGGAVAATLVSKVAAFFGGPFAAIAAESIVQIVTSIRRCSTCSDEKCALRYGQYKDYSLISNRLCHQVASKCTSNLRIGPIKKCLRTGYRHCCYNSKFARILVEQAYTQLGYSWGSYDNATCTNLTFDDLKRLDFSAMDFSEFIEEIRAKMKGNFNEQQLQQRVRDRIAIP